MASETNAIHRLADHLQLELSRDQHDALAAFAQWLVDEAIPAGGLGPREAERVWDRHVADSVAFAAGWETPPSEILDIGTGVGLPGIPLAILFPETTVTLLDRGGRRIRLLHRAARILGLTNVSIAQADAFSVADEWEGLTFRGSVTAPEAVGLTARLLGIPGTAVLGLSRRNEVPERSRDLMGIAEAMGLAPNLVEIPQGILATAAWLLIMHLGE